MNRALDQHRYHEAAQALWDFIWHEFCDWYLEVKKHRFAENSGLDPHWKAVLTVYESDAAFAASLSCRSSRKSCGSG